ncbi:MAG: alpha/beta hydrolase [Candidatus Dormibacteraceae bacterium]
MSSTLFWGLAGLMGAGLGAYLLITVLVWHRVFVPPRPSLPERFLFTPAEFQADYEELNLITADGIGFGAWFFRQPGTPQVIVVSPSHRSNRERFLGVSIALWRKGFNVLLYAPRGMAGSERAILTLGVNEVWELEAVLEYVRGRIRDPQIGLLGYSMGAAVSLLVAARDPALSALVLDSPFGDAGQFLSENIGRRLHLPGAPFRAAMALWLWLRHGVRLSNSSPRRVLAQVEPLPLFFIQGGDDRITTARQVRQLYDAYRGPREIWLVPGAAHCAAYWVDRPLYVERVAGFFARQLGLKSSRLRLVTEEDEHP